MKTRIYAAPAGKGLTLVILVPAVAKTNVFSGTVCGHTKRVGLQLDLSAINLINNRFIRINIISHTFLLHHQPVSRYVVEMLFLPFTSEAQLQVGEFFF